jgi:hypothetical protein
VVVRVVTLGAVVVVVGAAREGAPFVVVALAAPPFAAALAVAFAP